MKYAFLFPGQGSQYVGMGKNLAENFTEVHALFEEASDSLGYDLAKICFDGPETDLTLTQNTQPAILTVSIAAFRVLQKEKNITPTVVAGHSLGEYSALVAAGALIFSEAVRVVHSRGKYMQEAVARGRGAMAALMGGTNEATEKLCKEAAAISGKICEMANFNGGGQLVISGEKEAVEEAVKIAESNKDYGIRRAVLLPVSAPFHCSLMKPAADRLLPELEAMNVGALRFPYIANIHAKTVRDSSQIAPNLFQQIASPVLWEQSISSLPNLEISHALEIGPGKVLSGLQKRIVKEIPCVSVESAESFKNILV